ncbi:LacI family DNA-binding transcriptional regulator [Roseinatronobacter alkalisoli]|uniref:LacI family DNA-binding transcriptional regulator n=1 Tax=Roseinatronobacter alkalisoli TaxID=3028235 RepID=A0ABT5TB53_9RHOB|nr:LacI family DNA-binding transcriptional regulator [Roseinatronobacter sp. HJB301]MDD7972216.1 LacI family DNA-binding transcriptional regulator [Roseinatronobacter sp. HJB301]
MKKTQPKIKDVAFVAGVSTATVSRALTQPDRLSAPTRQKVFDAIHSTGYRVNQAARNLRTRRAGAVLVLVPNLGNPFFSAILSSINDVLAANGYSVLVFDSQQPGASEHAVADCFLNGSVDGMITLDGHMSDATGHALRSTNMMQQVVFCCEWSDQWQLPSIRSNNGLGTRLVVDHLVALGHRRIAHVAGPAENILAEVRKKAFAQRCAIHGLDISPDWIVEGDFSLGAGARAAERILALSERPTAVFCASDAMALSFITRCQQLGVAVPQDISVVGFDDIELAAFMEPGLTTIRQDRSGLGRLAAQELLARLRGEQKTEGAHVIFAPVALIERGTTAAPP